MLDFRNLTSSSSNRRMRVIMPPHSNFGLNRTTRSRVIAKKWFSIWRPPPSWIWEFLHFCHVSVTLLKICVCVPDFVKFGRFAAETWIYNNFQNGGRPPCWIYCDVIILYKKTEFNALDIVLNFDIYQFHTFWYTSTIMFHHFSLKLPIFALIFTHFLKKIQENIKCKYRNPQKAHLCVRPRVLNASCLTHFNICDLYTRRKKLFDWLIDCLIACL